MGNDSSKLRTDIKANGRYINILLVGEQGTGKSSFINTTHSAITEQRDHILAQPANQNAKGRGRTTVHYRMFDLKYAKIRLFDLPGADFASAGELKVLSKVLGGIPSPTEFHFDGDDGLIMMDPQVPVASENKIDFVFFMVDTTSLQNLIGQRGVNEQGRGYFKEIVALVQKHCNGLSPYMVFTKKDQTYLSAEDLMKAFAWFPDTHKWIITNYTTRGEWSYESDEVALKIIHNVVELFFVLES